MHENFKFELGKDVQKCLKVRDELYPDIKAWTVHVNYYQDGDHQVSVKHTDSINDIEIAMVKEGILVDKKKHTQQLLNK
jgi:hypothetical protein